jgi:hypothetical protein
VHHHYKLSGQFRRYRVLVAMTVLLAMGWSAAAGAAVPALSQVAEKYISCSKPILREHGHYTSQGRGGFGAVIQGEAVYFDLADRILVAFDSANHAETVVHLKIDRPLVNEFNGQAVWRERMLQDVADRSGVVLDRSSPRAGITLFTINKTGLTGKFAGQSMLIDQDRDVMVEWDWNILERYRGPNDVKALQTEVWKYLIPCLD